MMVLHSHEIAHSLNVLFASQWTVLGGDLFPFTSEKYLTPVPKGYKGGDKQVALMCSFPGEEMRCQSRSTLQEIR